jgi:hypothetical protein
MAQTDLWQDITTTVQRALDARLDQRTEAGLVRHSDALLTQLAGLRGSQQLTTRSLLRRYATPLHHELCRGQHPRAAGASVTEELCDLTRAMLVTVGATEGVSIEAAVGLALVLYKRGVVSFCAVPARPTSTAQLA